MKKTNLLHNVSRGKALLIFLLLVALLGMYLMDINFFSEFGLPTLWVDLVSCMLSLLFSLCCVGLNWYKPYGVELTAEGYRIIDENSSPHPFSFKKRIICYISDTFGNDDKINPESNLVNKDSVSSQNQEDKTSPEECVLNRSEGWELTLPIAKAGGEKTYKVEIVEKVATFTIAFRPKEEDESIYFKTEFLYSYWF